MKKLIVFGAGRHGLQLAKMLQNSAIKRELVEAGGDLEIRYFTCNTREKWGGRCCGIPVLSPKEMLWHLNEVDGICISTQTYADEIMRQLLKYDVSVPVYLTPDYVYDYQWGTDRPVLVEMNVKIPDSNMQRDALQTGSSGVEAMYRRTKQSAGQLPISYKTVDQIQDICGCMEDEQSRIILKQRFLYSLTHERRYFYEMLPMIGFSLDWLDGMYEEMVKWYRGQELLPREDLLTWIYKKRCEKLVIFGCDQMGAEMELQLRSVGISIFAFVDNYKEGQYLRYPILKPEEIPKGAYIVIASQLSWEIIFSQLKNMGFREEDIFIPGTNALWCRFGTPYFDEEIFQPMDEGVFIDGGAWRGETAIEFAKWAKSYQKIISFEPDKKNYCCLKETLATSELTNIMPVNAGLWYEDGELSLTRAGDNGTGSYISENGQEKITTRTLDSFAEGKVTFIKLDIEGAELAALMGAQKTIQRDKPRMAICIYHKPEDIWEIPHYIKSLVPEYHMAVRHYMTYLYDTVLYCWI